MSNRKTEPRTSRPLTPTLKAASWALGVLVPLAVAFGAWQRVELGLGTWVDESDLFLAGILWAVFIWTVNIQTCETQTIRAVRIGSVYVGYCSSGPVIYPGYYVAKRLFEEERATELLQHLSQQGYV